MLSEKTTGEIDINLKEKSLLCLLLRDLRVLCMRWFDLETELAKAASLLPEGGLADRIDAFASCRQAILGLIEDYEENGEVKGLLDRCSNDETIETPELTPPPIVTWVNKSKAEVNCTYFARIFTRQGRSFSLDCMINPNNNLITLLLVLSWWLELGDSLHHIDLFAYNEKKLIGTWTISDEDVRSLEIHFLVENGDVVATQIKVR